MLKRLLIASCLLYQVNLYAVETLEVALFQSTETFLPARQLKNKSFDFTPPDIQLIDQNNQQISLKKLFAPDNELVFAFFFTQCISVCTTTTLSLKSIQPQLSPDTQIAMISIDPETDTTELLRNYANKHHIKQNNWHLLTGNIDQIVKFQKSFEAYRGNKMNHNTSLFIKKSGSSLITEIKNNFINIPTLLK